MHGGRTRGRARDAVGRARPDDAPRAVADSPAPPSPSQGGSDWPREPLTRRELPGRRRAALGLDDEEKYPEARVVGQRGEGRGKARARKSAEVYLRTRRSVSALSGRGGIGRLPPRRRAAPRGHGRPWHRQKETPGLRILPVIEDEFGASSSLRRSD